VFEEGSWRIRNDNDIEHILEKHDLVRFIRAGTIIWLDWLDYVQKMDEEKTAKRIMHARM